MNCPKCGFDKSFIVNSRKAANETRRRHQCEKCKHRWTTYEVMEKIYKDAKFKMIFQKKMEILIKTYLNQMTAQEQIKFLDEIK